MQNKIALTLIIIANVLVAGGALCTSLSVRSLRQEQSRFNELLQHTNEIEARKHSAVLQIFETPDHKWQIRVARPADGLFEIVPIDPENLPGGQPIGQKPGI